MDNNKILAPKLGVNDEFVTIGSWLVKTGEKVEKDQVIASVESTKEVQELISDFEGYIQCLVRDGEEVQIGEVIANIYPKKDEILQDESKVQDSKEIQATKKALELAKEHNIDLSQIKSDGIIREKDVIKFINGDSEIERCKSNELIIIGGSRLAKIVIDTIRSMGGYGIAGITDACLPLGSEIMGVSVLGNDDILDEKFNEGHRCAVNAVGSITHLNDSKLFSLRKKLFKLAKEKGFFLPNIIHHDAIVEKSAVMGEGNLIFAGAYVGSETLIGSNCIINNGAIVSHDCKIANHARISPNATLAGNVTVGENALIGMGATIYIGVKIGKNAVIGNGANVFSNVPDNAVIK